MPAQSPFLVSSRCALSVVMCLLVIPAALAVDWDIETICPSSVNGTPPGLALLVDRDNNPHIAHTMQLGFGLEYAVRLNGAWTFETVDGQTCESGAIALDASGQPCIAYRASGPGELRYARRAGGVWSTEYIDQMNWVRTGLVFTSGDVPHVLYGQPDDPWYLMHAWNPGSGWQTEVVDYTPASAYDIAALSDGREKIYVVHWGAPNYGNGPFEEKYAHFDGASWTNQVIDGSVENCNVIGSGIAADSQGRIHAAYGTHCCGGSCTLNYAVLDAGQWQIQPVVGQLPGSAACDLVLDSAGQPHIFFGTQFSSGNGNSILQYAHRDGATWVIDTIDATANAGEITRAAVDKDGYLHVVYTATSGSIAEIRYARSRTPVGGLKGDLDCDGHVNFADINPFVLALSDPGAYQAQYPNCNINNGDVNNDGHVDFADINPFVALLAGP